MKWLKIKKYLKIFSVIICSIFIFSNKASALETKDFYFDSETYVSDIRHTLRTYDLISKFNDLFNYIEENSKYEYLFSFGINNGKNISMRLFLIQDVSKVKLFQVVGDNYPEIMIGNSDYIYVDTIDSFNINLSDTNWDVFFENFKLNFDKKNNTPNWWKLHYMNTFLFVDENNYIKNDNSFFLKSSFDLNLSLDENQNNSKIIFDIGFVLEEGVSLQSFINQLNIFDQTDYPLKYRTQFNNDVSPNLKQITFDFSSWEYTEGSNPVKSKIEIGNWNNTSNLANYLTQNIMGHGIDGIEYDVNEYFDVQIETVDYLTTKELTFTYNLKKELPENILRIKVYYDFETFDDNYFFNVFDNTSWGSPDWRYIENFLVGYKKYTFPDGYDLAIIRSKSFNDLKSFYISDKLYFTSPEYGYELKSYDFINKVVTYNFNSLTQYLFNPVYLKIPLVIDETNNIFPVLTKPLNTEKGVFYLKDDLFVQFVNSDTLESIVENIPDDEFYQNNDLILGDNVSDLKPIEINKEESLYQFFNGFWEKFKYFSDIFSYITACFTEFFFSLPSTIQFFLSASFAFIIFKLITYLIL